MSKLLFSQKATNTETDYIEKGGDKQIDEVIGQNGQIQTDVENVDTFVDNNGQVTAVETNSQGLNKVDNFNVGN